MRKKKKKNAVDNLWIVCGKKVYKPPVMHTHKKGLWITWILSTSCPQVVNNILIN